jgi:hypothetical protein
MKKFIIAIIAILAVGGVTYKILNPTPYKHPMYR